MSADVLELARGDLPAPLATTDSVEALAAVAALMPGFPTVGFECRLGARDGPLDLQVATQRTDREATWRSLARARERDGLSSVWARVHDLCREWSTPGTLLHDGLAELWCEIDAVSSSGATALADVVPSVFAVLDPSAGVDRQAVAERALEHLVADEQRGVLRPMLERCASACRGRARLSHVGVMLGRPVAAMRLHVSDVPQARIPEYLEDVGWPGDVDRARTVARRLLDHGDRVVLCLDVVGADLLPRLGVECFFDQKVGVDPRWRALLDGLVEAGLGSSEKAAALLDWPGVITPTDGRAAWPAGLIVRSLTQAADRLGVVERRLSHVKLAFATDEPVSAKAYFGAAHVWWRAGAAADAAPRPRALRPAASADDAVDAATTFLLGARNQAGWWRDFFDRARPAGVDRRVAGYASDEWVTAYVGSVMAAIDRPAARTAAREVLDLLLARRGDAGWGYHALLPPDADTTTWVLRLAAALDAPQSERLRGARSFVAKLADASGGVATYGADAAAQLESFLQMPGPYDGWCATHVCVTAAAAMLDGGAGSLGFLARAQRPDGSWAGHWWDDDEYTTLRAVESLTAAGAERPAVRRAVRWAAGRIGADGSVRSARHGGPSAFATALALHTVITGAAGSGERPPDAASRAAAWLLSQQREDGSWAGSARLRVPAPRQRDPLAAPETTLTYLDDESLFTTATVLAALAASAAGPASA